MQRFGGISLAINGASKSADVGTYAAFGGYTPTLAGYVSVFNPLNPTNPSGEMMGAHSCYREVSGPLDCPGQMFGDNAPGATWQMTFLHAALGPVPEFVDVPTTSPFHSEGGVISANPPKKKTGGPGHGGGDGPGRGGGPVHH